jgi:hypothetical protein
MTKKGFVAQIHIKQEKTLRGPELRPARKRKKKG